MLCESSQGLSAKTEKELLQYLQDSNRSKRFVSGREDPALDVSLKLRLLMLCEARMLVSWVQPWQYNFPLAGFN